MTASFDHRGGYRDTAQREARRSTNTRLDTRAGLAFLGVVAGAWVGLGMLFAFYTLVFLCVACCCASASLVWLSVGALTVEVAVALAASRVERTTDSELVTLHGRIDRHRGRARFVSSDGTAYRLMPRWASGFAQSLGPADARVHPAWRIALAWRTTADPGDDLDVRQRALDAAFGVTSDRRRRLREHCTWSRGWVAPRHFDEVAGPTRASVLASTDALLSPLTHHEYVVGSPAICALRAWEEVRVLHEAEEHRLLAIELVESPPPVKTLDEVLAELRDEYR